MKKYLIFSSALLFVFISIEAQKNIYDTIVHGPLHRTFLLHIPSSYNSANPTPLVIALHGGGSPGWYTFEQATQLSSKSNSGGFLLVYPEGIKVAGVRAWNGGGCCSFAVTAKVDDVGFINALIDTIRSEYNIDTTRIYATGLSNGAIMTYRLASELSHRIAAIAPVSGTLEDSAYVCHLSRPVPVIQFHSVLDSNIYLLGGYGTKGYLEHQFNSVNYGLQKFASFNNCNSAPDSNFHVSGNSFYYKKRWQPCDCNSEQILYVTGDGGHSWPGGSTGAGEDADPPSTIIHANDSIWNFFQKHTLVCNTTYVPGSLESISQIKIHPNPFSLQTTVQTNKILKDATLSVYNSYGQLVKQVKNISMSTIIFKRDGLPGGFYFLQLTEDNRVIAAKKIEICD
jgi:polyhydroxybutyrate depolymerase